MPTFSKSSVRSIEELLDDGPETCLFYDTMKKIQKFRSIRDVSEYLLSFSKEHLDRIDKLEQLIKEYQDLINNNHPINQLIVAKSVSKWIFYTNKIEFLGTKLEGDTEEIVSKGYSIHKTRTEKEVLQTLKLLKTTYSEDIYNSKEPELKISFDTEKIKYWHTILVQDIEPTAGNFRKSLAYSDNMNGSIYKFPHHSIVQKAIPDLCELIYRMIKYISKTYITSNRKLQYTIALASFAQFHFVDIHPFKDGNGRMCRFISKRMLDWVLPLPVPMFLDRNKYLKALEDARLPNTMPDSPLSLYKLVIDECISQYKEILQIYKGIIFKDLIVAKSEEDLKYQLRGKTYSNISEELIELFRNLNDDDTVDRKTENMIIRIKKCPEICIDDI